MTALHLKTLISGSPLRFARLLLPLAFACFALCPMAQAVSPAPDGAYPGGNTAEGNAALRDLTTGTFNTAVGLFSLTLNTGGGSNTGVGASALISPSATKVLLRRRIPSVLARREMSWHPRRGIFRTGRLSLAFMGLLPLTMPYRS
jgi:hypothetical protein